LPAWLIRTTLSCTWPQRLRVETQEGSSEQHEPRLEHQRPGELDHPPLPAREVPGLLGPALAHDREELLDLRVALAQQRRSRRSM
jgi:hypothetical protein